MFNKKYRKAITFSFDDGVTQDRRLIALFAKYNLKCTFNLNSGSLGKLGEINYQGFHATHNKVSPKEVKSLYQNHEVAVHTVNHPDLTKCSEQQIADEINVDASSLEQLAGYPIVGMAYPFGTTNKDVIQVIKAKTNIVYSRTIEATYNFSYPEELIEWRPTVHCLDFEHLFALAQEFVHLKPQKDQLFYIWGHAYEFDFADTWNRFEEFLKLIANHDDILYATNIEIIRGHDHA